MNNAAVIRLNQFLLTVRRQSACGLAVLLLASLVVSACGKQAKRVITPAPLPLVEGKTFPAITLKTLSGESVPLQSLQGKMLILNVWATWCLPCRREMPSLERLSKALDPECFAVLGMSIDGDELLASEFLNSNHISFGNYFDRKGNLAQQLGVGAYPETFLIARDGTLLKRVLGQQDWSSPAMLQMLKNTYQSSQHTQDGDGSCSK